MNFTPIAHFHSPYTSKFGIPRQSGLIEQLDGYIVFTSEWRNDDALRGIEGFDYLWILWEFSANRRITPHESMLVRPPLLGGNEKRGVFATRSPFRPNPIGLSSVHLTRIDYKDAEGPIIYVKGADLMDGTPIFDIKPYLPYTDSHPEARSGFQEEKAWESLQVEIDSKWREVFSESQFQSLVKTLELDPRPQYQSDKDKVYGLEFLGHNIRFRVKDNVLIVIN